jgi:hypothetical protein
MTVNTANINEYLFVIDDFLNKSFGVGTVDNDRHRIDSRNIPIRHHNIVVITSFLFDHRTVASKIIFLINKN